jgi:uncharacterized membrane protein YqjE
MAQEDNRQQAATWGDGRGQWQDSPAYQDGNTAAGEGPSLGELLKRLSTDMGSLVSQELALAKAEMRDSVSEAVKGVTKLSVAMALALAGAIALTAFLILGLGGVLDDRYWLSALIVGVVELGLGIWAAKSAIKSMGEATQKPTETVESLKEDKQWASREMKDLKREMTSGDAPAQTGR